MTEEENHNNLKKCSRFDSCSVPKCPLDFWVEKRIELPGEDRCPLMIRRKTKVEKKRGIKYRLNDSCLLVVPEKNLKWLNYRSLKRYQTLNKKPQLLLF